MGRKTDVLLRGFRAAKCLTVLKLASSRIKVHRNKRSVSAKQMRAEIAQLLKTGQEAQVYITKAEALIKQENMVAVYDIIDQYCHAIIGRFPTIEMQSNCPIDMKEPIASLIFAAPRCVELSELATIKEAFIAKYGKEFAVAAAELRPDCGVNKRVVELLSIRPATGEMKLKIMKEICAEYKVNWTPGEALAESSISSQAGSSQQPVKTNVEAAKVTGEAGTSKPTAAQAAPSRVNESAPSNLGSATKPAMPGGFKPEGINKPGKPEGINKPGLAPVVTPLKPVVLTPDASKPSGLAAVVTPLKPVVLTPDASKPSGPKHGLASQQGAEKASASVSQSVKGAANSAIASVKAGLAAAGSSKTGGGAVFAANAFQTNVRKEESAGAAGLQSFQGVIYTGSSSAVSGSSKESIGEPVAKAEGYVPVVDPQDGSSDSDNDSFVSFEEGRFEDDAEASSMGGASLEADGHGPSLVKNPSRERPHEDVYSKASSKKSSFTLDSSHKVMSAKASLNTDALQKEGPVRAESRKNSSREEKKSNDLIMESLITDALQQEKPFRAETRKSSLREEKSSGLLSESLKTEALQEEKPFRAESLKTEALQEGKPFGAESRKSSLAEEKNSGLIMNTDALLEEKVLRAERRKSSGLIMESSQEDMYLRASSKKSSASDTPQEEKVFRAGSRKNNLSEKKVVEEESFKHVEENYLLKQQLGKAQYFEENGLQRKKSFKGEEYPFEEQENGMTTGDGLQENVLTEDTFTESLRVDKLVESKKRMSLSDGISAEGMSSRAGEEVVGKESSSAIVQSPERVSKQLDGVPPTGKGVPEILGSASLGDLTTPDHFAAAAKAIGAEGGFGALATPDDFAAAAKAVAEEAARLAVLDYAKRMAGSGAIPVDLTDLTKFGLDFNGGSQATKKLHSESKSNITNDRKEALEGGDITNDVKEEASKMIGGKGFADLENSMLFKTPSADDGGNGYNASSNPLEQAGSLAKDESLQQPDVDSENYELNPFATEVDKAPNSRFSEAGENDSSSWAKPELINKAGGFVQEEDHLDIFFRRKTPMFDEDSGYIFPKLNPSLQEEKAPYFGYGKTERISQDKFFVSSTPVFDSFSERQNVVVEESSGSFQGPVFDGGSEKYDASFSFDDGVDKKIPSVGISDQNIPQFDMEASARFDSEPEPLFDKVEEEVEQLVIQKIEPAQQVGHLKWQSKKPTKASEEATSGEILGDDSKPMSRRTRKNPKRVDEYAYDSEIPAQAKPTSKWPEGSSSSLMQQQQKEQGRYDTADEEGGLRTKPAESFAYSIDAMGKRPARSPERVSYDLSEENQSDRWDSISSVGDRFPTINKKKSPTRSSQRPKVPIEESYEDFYFSEDIVNSPARSSMSKTSKSPTRMAKQQVLPQGYDDDAKAYRFSNQPSRIPNFSRQDLADDDSFKEPPVARYKPYRQNDELGMDTSSNLAMYRQKPHRQQEDYNSEGARMQYVQASVGKSNPSSRPSARQKQQYVEEEDDLAFGYKPAVQVDGRGKSSSTRPPSSMTKFEEEKQYLSPRYKPGAQVDDVGRASSSPLSGRRQRYQRPQEEEHEVSMEEYEKEEFFSNPLPDRRQGDHRKGQQGIPRPRYGQKQGLRLKEENSDSSAEDYEQEQEKQRRPSILSEQEKPRRRLPARGQEKPQRPLPVSQEYEDEELMPRAQEYEEERMPRTRHGRKQDLRMEEEDSDFRIGDYGHPIFSEEKQAGKEAVRRPSPAFYDQEEEYKSMHLPDRRQEEQRKEERMSRPLHGQKQNSRLEKETLDLSEEDYEYREEQEQGKQGRQRQENRRQPLPPLHQYEHEEEKEVFDAISLPDWRQEECQKEKKPISRPLYGKEREPISRPVYGQTQNSRPEKASVNLSIEDYEQQDEEPGLASMPSKQEQYGQEKHRRPSPPYGRQTDSKPGKENPEPWKQEKIQQEQRRPSADRLQQQSLAEEVARKGQQGWEKERLPSQVYTRPQEVQEEKKILESSVEHDEPSKEKPLQQSAVSEEKQEQDGQENEKRPWPLRNRKQESKEDIKEQLPARQSLPKDEGMKVSQEKPEAKAKPSSRRPSSVPDSSSLESSISDPVVLATIPPPVKKLSIRRFPEATTLESSVSSPSPATAAEVKVPKVPQKPPNLDDLRANFEALRKARRAE